MDITDIACLALTPLPNKTIRGLLDIVIATFYFSMTIILKIMNVCATDACFVDEHCILTLFVSLLRRSQGKTSQ